MKGAVLAVALLLTGLCAACISLETISSAHTGCPEKEIEIFNDRTYNTSRAWSARCRGRVYYCVESQTTTKCTVDPTSIVLRPKAPLRARRIGPCRFDNDCKGDEICHLGKCVDTEALRRSPTAADSDPPPRPTDPNAPFEERMGITLGEAAKHAAELRLKAATGAVLLSVKPDSIAGLKGLRRGDVIVDLALSQVKSVADVQRLAKTLQPGQSFNIIVRRKGTIFSLFMRL